MLMMFWGKAMARKKGSIDAREGQGGRVQEGGMGYTGPGSDYLSGGVTSASRSSFIEGSDQVTRTKGERKSADK